MTKHHKTEVPGNVLATAAMTERILARTGLSVHKATYRMEVMLEEGIEITAIKFRATAGPTGEWLAIVTARTENNGVVAFHSGTSFAECLEGVCNRIVNGSLKWKEDEYA